MRTFHLRWGPLWAVPALCVLAAAQDQPTAAAFLPAQYHAEVLVDLGRLRDSGLWTALQRTPLLQPVCTQLEHHLGLQLDALNRIRGAARWRSEASSRGRSPTVGVLAFEGCEPLTLPAGPRFELATGGAYPTALERTGSFDRLWCAPGEHLLVAGDPEHLRAVVQRLRGGSAATGEPAPELADLLTGHDPLAFVALGRFDLTFEDWASRLPVPRSWLLERDPLELIWVGIDVTRSGHLVLSAVARFATGNTGADLLHTELVRWLARAEMHPRLGALAAQWRNVQIRRVGRDLIAGLDLGAPQAAAEVLLEAAGPLLAMLAPEIPLPEGTKTGIQPLPNPTPDPEGR